MQKWLSQDETASKNNPRENPRLDEDSLRALAENGINWEEGMTVVGIANRALDSQIQPEHRITAADMMPWLRHCSSCRSVQCSA